MDPYREILPLIGSKEGSPTSRSSTSARATSRCFPDPGYQPYLGGTLLAGGEPYAVPLRPENDFLIPLDDIPDDVARRTRVLYLNYPNNPTAAIAPRSYLEDAVRFCRERGAVLVYDNAYSEIAFDGYPRPASSRSTAHGTSPSSSTRSRRRTT
jgi:LL-diaminopimelate aminotransferase